MFSSKIIKKMLILGVLSLSLGFVSLSSVLESASAKPYCQAVCSGGFLIATAWNSQLNQCASTGQVVGYCQDGGVCQIVCIGDYRVQMVWSPQENQCVPGPVVGYCAF